MKRPDPEKTATRAPARSGRKAVQPPPQGAGKGSRIDPALIEEIGDIASRLGLSEIEVEHDGLRIRVARQIAFQSIAPATVVPAPSATVAPPPAATTTAAAAILDVEHPGAVKSPMVGTAYRRPSPNDKPFVDVGSIVKAGDKILLVEAMKTFNEIVAPRAGTITSILVEDGQPVEYGQILVVIE